MVNTGITFQDQLRYDVGMTSITPTTIRLSPDLSALARARAESLGVSLSALVAFALDAYMRQQPAPVPVPVPVPVPGVPGAALASQIPRSKRKRGGR